VWPEISPWGGTFAHLPTKNSFGVSTWFLISLENVCHHDKGPWVEDLLCSEETWLWGWLPVRAQPQVPPCRESFGLGRSGNDPVRWQTWSLTVDHNSLSRFKISSSLLTGTVSQKLSGTCQRVSGQLSGIVPCEKVGIKQELRERASAFDKSGF
jgi:hypothetical protein